jgi:rubrerythrin
MNNTQPTIGDNRTGIARAPERTEEMVRGNDEFAPTARMDDRPIAEVRQEYAKEGEPLGTLPPPASAKQLGKTAVAALKKGSPNLFMDKLGERAAFERSGVRLYQALISKHEAGSFDGGPTRADLLQIMEEELQHYLLVKEAIERLGGDPTAMTPSADVHATASEGLRAVLVDPRTNLLQSLEVIMIAELADNECWDGLIELARKAGEEELVRAFTTARDHEREHLLKVRSWLAAGQGRDRVAAE